MCTRKSFWYGFCFGQDSSSIGSPRVVTLSHYKHQIWLNAISDGYFLGHRFSLLALILIAISLVPFSLHSFVAVTGRLLQCFRFPACGLYHCRRCPCDFFNSKYGTSNSTATPASITIIRSESMTVCNRWATVSTVHCLNLMRMVRWIRASVLRE